MPTKVMIISKDAEDKVEQLMNGLSKNGLMTDSCLPEINEVQAAMMEVDAVLIYMDGTILSVAGSLRYIAGLSASENKPLFAVGNAQMLERLSELAGDKSVEALFYDPQDVKRIAAAIKSVVGSDDDDAEIIKNRVSSHSASEKEKNDSNKTMLIISHGSAFMVDSLVTNLKKAGFNVESCEPDMDTIREKKDQARSILIFAGNMVLASSELLSYVRDICTTGRKTLYVIGHKDEHKLIEKNIPFHCITKSFTRPFEMKELITDIKRYEEQLKNNDGSGDIDTDSKHILLCDDDLMFLKMMQSWLSMNYKVNVVKSGAQAISFIAKNKPDLILLDYDMPVTSGPQIMEMIRNEPDSADIPIIFLTGKSDKESVMNVMKLKPQGYLLKSMSKESIVAQVDNFFLTKKWKNV